VIFLPGMMNRRVFVGTIATQALATQMPAADEPVLDLHQHTNYAGRTDEELIRHQREMGVTKTVLLPAGSKYGLAVRAGGNETALALARQYPAQFVFFANELPDLPETKAVLEQYLKLGAIGIGEQKFPVQADSKHVDLLAEIARDYSVPILMHFESEHYNLGFEDFHKVLERHPRVNFIGHAQTWWGNIDKNHLQATMKPTGKVTPGGITDRLLSDYPNMFGDMSAGSGLNALLRDEEHATAFMKRHRDKLIYGSDCDDRDATKPTCQGRNTLAAIRRLAPDKAIERKILWENGNRLLKLR
jgi:predicted TIM-barrel fold metal-dependent hydrolase